MARSRVCFRVFESLCFRTSSIGGYLYVSDWQRASTVSYEPMQFFFEPQGDSMGELVRAKQDLGKIRDVFGKVHLVL